MAGAVAVGAMNGSRASIAAAPARIASGDSGVSTVIAPSSRNRCTSSGEIDSTTGER